MTLPLEPVAGVGAVNWIEIAIVHSYFFSRKCTYVVLDIALARRWDTEFRSSVWNTIWNMDTICHSQAGRKWAL